MLAHVGLRYPHRASGAKAPRTLRPLPLLRFAVSATGGAHLCSTKYCLRFWLGIWRTSRAVSALRMMRYYPNLAASEKTPGFIFAKAFCPAGPMGPAHAESGKFLGAEKANAGNIFCHFGCGLGKIKQKTGILAHGIQKIKCGTAYNTSKKEKK